MHARPPTFLVATWYWSLILCRAKPQLLIIAPGTFRACNILVPHASGGCLRDLSMPTSTVPESCPQCPCEVSATLFSGQNLICLVFYLGLHNCVLFYLLWVTVSLEKREGCCSLLYVPGPMCCSFAQFAIHLFINVSMTWLKEMETHSACLEVSRQMWSQKERTLNEVDGLYLLNFVHMPGYWDLQQSLPLSHLWFTTELRSSARQ